jgi:glycosyltransferase involved in cell wall biosynthesis
MSLAVVIAGYDCADTLQSALVSLQCQSSAPSEVLVVDDCSPVPLRLPDTRLNFPVRMLRTEVNGGPGAARNLGISLTGAEYIAVQDADDVSHPQRFECQLAELRAAPHLVGLTTQAVLFDGSGRLGAHPRTPTSSEDINDHFDAGRMRLIHASLVMRRSAWAAAGGYPTDRRRGEDFEFFQRLRKVGPLAASTQLLYGYRKGKVTPLREYVGDSEGKHGRNLLAAQDWLRPSTVRAMVRYPGHVLKRSTQGKLTPGDRADWERLLENFGALS